jgi:fructose-bisphosphate aldolase class 1
MYTTMERGVKNTSSLNNQQLQKMKSHPGFIAALDQRGGSTPDVYNQSDGTGERR